MCNAGRLPEPLGDMTNSCKSNESLENIYFQSCRSLNRDLDGADSNVAGIVCPVLDSIPMTVKCTFMECRQSGSHALSLVAIHFVVLLPLSIRGTVAISNLRREPHFHERYPLSTFIHLYPPLSTSTCPAPCPGALAVACGALLPVSIGRGVGLCRAGVDAVL